MANTIRDRGTGLASVDAAPGRGSARSLTALVAIGAALPVAVLPVAYERVGLPRLVGAELAIAVVVMAYALRERSSRAGLALTACLIGQLIWFLAATVLSISPTLSLVGSYARWSGLATLVTCTLALWIGAEGIGSWRRLNWVFAGFAWSAAAVSFVAIADWVFRWSTVGVESSPPGLASEGIPRAAALLGSPSALGQYLALLIPFVVLAPDQRSARVAGLRTSVVVVALVLTMSRLAWLGALIGVLVAWSRAGFGGRQARKIFGAGAVSTFAVGAVIFLFPGLGTTLIDRLTSLLRGEDGSLGTRLGIWSDVLSMIRSQPVVGYGPDTFPLVFPLFESADWAPGAWIDRAHSAPLQLILDTGFIGAGLVAVPILVALIRAMTSGRAAAPAAGALVAYLVSTSGDVAWAPLMVLVSLLCGGLIGGSHLGESVPKAVITATRLVCFSLAIALAANAVRMIGADALFLQATSREEGRGLAAAAASLAPERGEYQAYLGELDWQRGDLRVAQIELARATALGATDVSVYRLLVSVSVKLGDSETAARAARRAVILNPFDPGARFLLYELAAP